MVLARSSQGERAVPLHVLHLLDDDRGWLSRGRDQDGSGLLVVDDPTTLVGALPHQYRVEAGAGTTLRIDLGVGGAWALTSLAAGRWTLDEYSAQVPDARVSFSSDAAWRRLTGADVPASEIEMDGPPSLTHPVLSVRGIIV